MDEKKETLDPQVNDVEVEPLSDSALESVAGGLAREADVDGSSGSCCSCSSCS